MNQMEMFDRPKIRAINDGTIYDIPARLRRLARQVEEGEHGNVTDILVVTMRRQENGARAVNGFHYGRGGLGNRLLMLEKAKEQTLST